MSEQPPWETLKWYTSARRFPRLVGRVPNGPKIPFGPYTIAQVMVFCVLLFGGWYTRGIWGAFGFFTNVVLLLAISFGTAYGLGKIPLGGRSLISVSSGIYRAATAPPTGRFRGSPVKVRRPHRLQHRFSLRIPAPPAGAADPNRPNTAGGVAATAAVSAHATTPAPSPAAAANPAALSVPAADPGPNPTGSGHEASPPSAAPPTAVPASGHRAPALTGVQALLASSSPATTQRQDRP